MRSILHRSSVVLLITAPFTVDGQINHARDLVNPFVGTGGHGHTFPGACVPNGLVQLSPDTRPDGMMDWDGCGGYHYSDSIIYGFSHTHLSGTGVADLCDVLITPVTGTGGMHFDRRATASRFDHATEQAHAGYYRVELTGPPHSSADMHSIGDAHPTRVPGARILAELTATQRVGVHRYDFPKGEMARIVVDLRHRDQLISSGWEMIDRNEIVGERRSSSWAKDQRLFFCIRFSAPWLDREVMPSALPDAVAGLTFGALEKPLVVKVGISAVSIEGARKNLDAEVPHWDFDLVRKQAENAWNRKLDKIRVQGGTKEQQRIFYTALYHCYVAPYIFNDVDGNYRGMDGEVHHADHNVYTVFSLWDTFRALHPLMTILEPDMTSDFIKTFLLHYQQGGRLPVWELWGNETDCMIGYHSASVIADAYRKGIRGFDEKLALEAMIVSADRDEPGLNAYRAKGFISSEDQSESVSRTLEYAYDDACIAGLMDLVDMDRKATGPSFWSRSSTFENLFDPGTGFFRARRNGGFIPGFDPYEVNFNFTEANAWQYSLFATQNIEKMISLYGDRSKLEAHLDRLFSANTATSGREQADITGLIGQYAHGNEPSHHMAYLYNHVERPEKTRALVKRILEEQYHDAPDGLSGNEDCGQMSAWYVMSALGLYQVSPGVNDRYDLGYPLFREASIDIGSGRRFTIAVSDSTWKQLDDAAWERQMQLEKAKNKKRIAAEQGEIPTRMKDDPLRITPTWIPHADILAGGVQRFDSQRVPQSRPANWPDVLDGAYVRECARPGAPVIEAAAAAFSDSLGITVQGCGKCTLHDAIGERDCPMNTPFTITVSSTIHVDWSEEFSPVTAEFKKMDGSRTITLASKYANQYAAGGDRALVDGLRGGSDFRTGEWQGYEGQDVLATIDLGAVKKVTRAGLSVLQDQRSWIWLPAEVQFAFSANGRNWSTVTATHDVPRDVPEAVVRELMSPPITKKARYVKVIARNAGPCPDWHPGKGGATWIFADEVLIETE